MIPKAYRILPAALCAAVLLSAASADAALQVTPPGNAGLMQDIDIGADGDIFGIARGSINGSNGHIYRWIHGEWRQFTTGYGIRVAVDNAGRPWHINGAGYIYRWVRRRWENVPGTAVAIDIGPNNEVFIIRTNRRVAKFDGTSFVDYGGSGDEITVDQEGHPWVLSGTGVWQHNGSSWRRHTGFIARDIDAGLNGVFALQANSYSDGIVYRYNAQSDNWTATAGAGVRLAVAPTNAPAMVTSGGDVVSHFAGRIHGDASCLSYERDCNLCAYDVRGQFRAQFDHGHRTSTDKTWNMNWLTTYPPSNRRPLEAFEDPGTIVVSDKHVQGFVKTRNVALPFAGSYSDDTIGSVFTITASSDLRHIISSESPEWHPSGIHALGDWIAVNENDNLHLHYLPNVNLGPFTFRATGGASLFSSGGGLGLARLERGNNGGRRYLVMSTNPGGDPDARIRNSSVWELRGDLAASSTALTYIGGNAHQLDWGDHYTTNENVTLITECETGQIYAAHTSGDYDLYGDGFWRLSRLEQNATGPVLRATDLFTEGQNAAGCHLRSAATAFVEPGGHIATYCHERDPNREWNEALEDVDFTERRPDYSSSCVGRCGGRAPDGCYCDSLCQDYGDCCNDAVTHCSEW